MTIKILEEGSGLDGHEWEIAGIEVLEKWLKKLKLDGFESLGKNSFYGKYRNIEVCHCGAVRLVEEYGLA